jgi:uncharacterized damage-inducible protein DinB
MFRTVSDFLRTWNYEREATLKVFSSLSEAVMAEKKNDNVRTLGRLAGHIVETLKEMPKRAGLDIEYHEEILQFTDVPELCEQYRTASERVAEKVAAQWTDGMLENTVEMYGEQWKLGQVLFTLITHQAHHRAQMTVLMRLVGLKVPGVYGPSKEEWAAFGAPAME